MVFCTQGKALSMTRNLKCERLTSCIIHERQLCVWSIANNIVTVKISLIGKYHFTVNEVVGSLHLSKRE